MSFFGLAAAAVLLRHDAVAQPLPAPTPIYGGAVSAPGAWPTAVAIRAGSVLCTGTLVAPNLVLTAAHCLNSGPDVATVSVSFGNDINQPTVPRIAALAYGFDPAFCAAETCKEDIHDYGYIILAIEQTIVPTRVVTSQDDWDAVMNVDQPITLVGYGLSDGGVVTGIKREVEVPITRFSKSGLEFQAGGDNKDSCQGDSGGPAFATLPSGEVVLVGITSRGYTCGKGGFYAVPYGGLCWLQAQGGLDLRPPGCAACDCLDTDPNRSDGCSCSADAPAQAGAWWLVFAALAWRQTRKRPVSSRPSSSSSSSSS